MLHSGAGQWSRSVAPTWPPQTVRGRNLGRLFAPHLSKQSAVCLKWTNHTCSPLGPKKQEAGKEENQCFSTVSRMNSHWFFFSPRICFLSWHSGKDSLGIRSLQRNSKRCLTCIVPNFWSQVPRRNSPQNTASVGQTSRFVQGGFVLEICRDIYSIGKTDSQT